MPELVPVKDAGGKIVDIAVTYPLDLKKQMLKFSGVGD